jgi:hypothetical protein
MKIISNIFSKGRQTKYFYGYKQNRANYYKQHNRVVSNRVLGNLFVKATNLEIQSVVIEKISPLNIELGSYYHEVLIAIEDYRFELNKGIGQHHKVIFCRKKIGSYKFLTQLHFYRNQLVYVKSDFDYLTIGNNSRTLLLNSLFNKYSIEGDYKMKKDIVLADRENNIMTILDNGKITLQYFAGDNELVDSLLSLNRLRGANLNKQKEEYALIQSVV